MSLHSCIYEGRVRHRRSVPVAHEFRYRLFMMYVDLQELPALFQKRWFWSAAHPNLAWFRRADHWGHREQPLADSIRDLVESQVGARPSGPIRLLTHFRYFGFGMNPISLYYCFNEREQIEFVVAEVTNTPWRERKCYVLDARGRSATSELTATHPKELHVSPFLGMDFDYRFFLSAPGPSLDVRIENLPRAAHADRPLFEATLALERRSITAGRLAGVLVRYPLMTARVFAAIYWQALRLRLKKVPLVPHPRYRSATSSGLSSQAGPEEVPLWHHQPQHPHT